MAIHGAKVTDEAGRLIWDGQLDNLVGYLHVNFDGLIRMSDVCKYTVPYDGVHAENQINAIKINR